MKIITYAEFSVKKKERQAAPLSCQIAFAYLLMLPTTAKSPPPIAPMEVR